MYCDHVVWLLLIVKNSSTQSFAKQTSKIINHHKKWFSETCFNHFGDLRWIHCKGFHRILCKGFYGFIWILYNGFNASRQNYWHMTFLRTSFCGFCSFCHKRFKFLNSLKTIQGESCFHGFKNFEPLTKNSTQTNVIQKLEFKTQKSEIASLAGQSAPSSNTPSCVLCGNVWVLLSCVENVLHLCVQTANITLYGERSKLPKRVDISNFLHEDLLWVSRGQDGC